MRPEHAVKFFGEGIPEGEPPKTLELRSFNCKCVPVNTPFYIVACQQGRNKNNIPVMKVLGIVVFRGNHNMLHSEVPSRFSEHRCTQKDYAALSHKWVKDFCVGWKVSDASKLPTPKWLKSNHQERCGTLVVSC